MGNGTVDGIARRGFLAGLLALPFATKVRALKTLVPRPLSKAVYSNRVVRHYIDVKAIKDRNWLLQPSEYAGEPACYRNIRIRVSDSLNA